MVPMSFSQSLMLFAKFAVLRLGVSATKHMGELLQVWILKQAIPCRGHKRTLTKIKLSLIPSVKFILFCSSSNIIIFSIFQLLFMPCGHVVITAYESYLKSGES